MNFPAYAYWIQKCETDGSDYWTMNNTNTMLDKVLMVEELLNEKQLNALRDILYF